MPHPVAVAGFSADADQYESGRPGYPGAATAKLVSAIDRGDVVLDVGAGTGKLTRVLAGTPATVVAIDPVGPMLEVASRFAPTAHMVVGTAEALPVGTGAVSAITAAQAFHWFDADRTWDEFARVLRPGGVVALIWNARLREVEWVTRLWTLMDRFERNAPWRDHDRGERFASHPAFTPVEHSAFRHTVAMDERSVVARVMSASHLAVLPPQEQKRIRSEIRSIIDIVDGPLEIGYRTDVLTRRRL